jgi:hypothetical protein
VLFDLPPLLINEFKVLYVHSHRMYASTKF